jgi:hypothetical protein
VCIALSLYGIGCVAEDKLIEVTLSAIRLQKQLLDAGQCECCECVLVCVLNNVVSCAERALHCAFTR